SHFFRPSRKAWAWACRLRGRLSRPTADSCRQRTCLVEAQSFTSDSRWISLNDCFWPIATYCADLGAPETSKLGPRAPAYSPPCCPGSADAGVRRSGRKQSCNAQALPSTLRTHRSRLESRVMGELKERTIGNMDVVLPPVSPLFPLFRIQNQRRIAAWVVARSVISGA